MRGEIVERRDIEKYNKRKVKINMEDKTESLEGYIYYVYNEDYPYVKMGRTADKESLWHRYRTTYANPEIESFKVKDQFSAEKHLHTLGGEYHYARELFKGLSKEKARDYCLIVQEKYKCETGKIGVTKHHNKDKLVQKIFDKSTEKNNWEKCCNEWKYIGYKQCANYCVCGMQIIYNYQLQNKETKELISVGSMCLQKFINTDIIEEHSNELIRMSRINKFKKTVEDLSNHQILRFQIDNIVKIDDFTIQFDTNEELMYLTDHFPLPIFQPNSQVMMLKTHLHFPLPKEKSIFISLHYNEDKISIHHKKIQLFSGDYDTIQDNLDLEYKLTTNSVASLKSQISQQALSIEQQKDDISTLETMSQVGVTDCQSLSLESDILSKLYSPLGFSFLAKFYKTSYDKVYFEIKTDTPVFSLLVKKEIIHSKKYLPVKVHSFVRGTLIDWFHLTIYCKDWQWKQKGTSGTCCHYISHFQT